MRHILIIILTAGTLCSCVSTKVYNALKAENLRLEAEGMSSSARMDELAARGDRMAAQNETLTADLARLQAEKEELDSKYRILLSQGSEDAARMLRQLEENQKQLEELEKLLRMREEAISSIRRKVADALLGFEGKGLTISTREGKVYVSMDDKLLFRSGSFDIDTGGAEAVRELSNLLAQNPDINIMVEGHTDDVPYRGSGQLRDNLDLSAKRATTVVRLILENQDIDPSRIIAAGRGESLPIVAEKTPEARARNRRTEIILTPKLDELMQLMDR